MDVSYTLVESAGETMAEIVSASDPRDRRMLGEMVSALMSRPVVMIGLAAVADGPGN